MATASETAMKLLPMLLQKHSLGGCTVDMRCRVIPCCGIAAAEAELIGSVAGVRSKILSSLVAQFGGQFTEGMINQSH